VNKEVPAFKNILVTMKEQIHFLGGKFFMAGSQQEVAKSTY
jgi:hypothetical protein